MNNRGIALVTGLLLLAAISLLALSGASGTILQRNMSINFQENALALQNASIAASYAMAWLNSRAVSERQAGCERQCLLPVGISHPGEIPGQPEFEGAQWWFSNAFAVGYNPESAETGATADQGAVAARWLIEELHYRTTGDHRAEGGAEGLGYYRILSRGTGRNARSIAVIETIVARPWDGDMQPGVYPPDETARAFCRQFGPRYDCGRLSWRQRR